MLIHLYHVSLELGFLQTFFKNPLLSLISQYVVIVSSEILTQITEHSELNISQGQRKFFEYKVLLFGHYGGNGQMIEERMYCKHK